MKRRFFITFSTLLFGAALGASLLAPAIRAQPSEPFDLGLINRLRDDLFGDTVVGRRYVDYYYDSYPEILRILLVDQPALGAQAVDTTVLFQPLLRDLLEGAGTLPVSQTQADALDAFLDALALAASTELQQLLATERGLIGPLDDLVGLSGAEAATRILGPRITIYRDGFEG